MKRLFKRFIRVQILSNNMGTLLWLTISFDGADASPVFLVSRNGNLKSYLLCNFIHGQFKVEVEP